MCDASSVYLPKLDSLKKTIRRARRRAANVPPEPTSLNDLEIPEVYKEVQNTRILIFGTQNNIEVMNTSSVWLADGTFKSAPNIFYQLYVVHALKGGPEPFENGHLLPSLFVLLPCKSQDIYETMWRKIEELCPIACPSHMIIDYEKAAINAFMEYFPDTTIKGCFFHLSQNIWRKVQEFSLQSRYQQDSVFALKIRMLPALAFATPTDIPEIFTKLFLELPPEAYELASYFESTYIGRHIASSIAIPSMFPIEMWNNHNLVHHGSHEPLTQ